MRRCHLFVVAFVLAFCPPPPGVRGQSPAPADGVESFLRSQMQKRHIPGLQVAVVRHGKVVKLGAYGLANVQDSVPVTDQTLFTINSATKSFTGVAVMQLVEEGKLDLAAPVSRYLDGLPGAWRGVTVRQMLTHTSGLPDIMDGWGKFVVEGDAEASRSKVRTMPMEFKPGEKFSYNQTNYVLLGEIIDKLSGQPFTRFITERQLNVANMPRTAEAGFGDSHDVVPHSARGYTFFRTVGDKHVRGETLGNVFEEFPPFMRTAAGMSSTAEEMARWIIALQGGKLLKHKDSLPTLWTPGVLNDGTPAGFGGLLKGYALGWPATVRPEHRAVGGIGGGRSAFLIYPEDDLAVVILTNLQGAEPQAFIDEVAGYYIPEMSAAAGFGLPPAVKALRAELMKRGFEHAAEVADEAKKKDAKYELLENDVNNWAYKLIEQGQPKNAVEVFKLNVTLYPKSWNAYDSLAEGYEALGDKAAAVKNFKRSLELNPKNDNAREQLKKLEPSADASPFPPDAEIQRVIDERVADGRVFGIVVATRDAAGKTRYYHAGSSGKDGLPLDGDTVFEIASISKTFTAALLADMVTRGEVKLDDPLAMYLPATVKVPGRNGKQITFADLVTHSSALPMAPDNISREAPNGWLDYTPDRMYQFLSGYTLSRDVGEKFEYSNVGLGLLGHALALHLGKSWEEAVAERILKPLDMADTRVTLSDGMRRRLAAAHGKSGQSVINWDIPYFPGMGGLRSTANDLLKYLVANMDPGGKPLGKAFALTRVSRRDAWTPKTKIGLAWIIGTGENKTVVWHGGNSIGYGSFVGYDPATRLCVVVLANTNSPVNDIGLYLIDRRNPLDEDPPVLKELRSTLAKRGYEHALEVVNERKAHDAKYSLPENDVNECAYRLLRQEKKKEALELFKLNVTLYPKSWNVYDSLAEGYEEAGDKPLAVKYYKRSLELNAKNDNAVEHLKKLEEQKGPPPPVPVQTSATQAEVVERLEKHLPELMKAGDVPGLAVTLIRDGRLVWHKGFGVKNSKTKEPVDDTTVFEAASLSKPVFAYAVLKLADSGKFDIDKPLNQYLPGNYDVGDDARLGQITARRVLSHTTGFPNWRGRDKLKIYFTPGERFSYSGEGMVYLSKVIEHVTGEKFNDFMKHTVFEPLGMTSSSYVWEDRYGKLKAFRHNSLGEPTGQNEPSPVNRDPANAAASLVTSARDYGLFVQAILQGTGLKPETRKLMLTPQVYVSAAGTNSLRNPQAKRLIDVAWGIGWGLQTTRDGTSFWHWGDNGDSKAYVVAFEHQKLGVVVFANSANGLSIVREIVADTVGGSQPAMEWLNYERYDSPARGLFKQILAKGAAGALGDFRKGPAGRPAAAAVGEVRMNQLGYDLLSLKRPADAIEVFKEIAAEYPKSANAYDSLAEGYEARGDKAEAIKNYKKSLELDPKNDNAVEHLKKLEPAEPKKAGAT